MVKKMGKMKFTNYTIGLSTKCNLRCKYCSIFRENPLPLEMSEKTVERLIEWIRETHDKKFLLHFLYAEPLLNFPYIKKIISELRKDNPNMKVTVTTNGVSLTKDKIKWIKKNNISLQVSIDGDEKSSKDRCDIKTYKRIIRNALNAQKNINDVTISYSITPSNVKRVPIGVKKLIGYGFKKIFLKPIDSGIPFLQTKKIDDYISNHFKAFIIGSKEYYSKNKVYINPPLFFNFFLNDKIKINKETYPFRCMAMNKGVFISPLGEVYPCSYFYQGFGHRNKIFDMGNIPNELNIKKINQFLENIKTEKRPDFFENEDFSKLKKISKLNSDQTYDLLAKCPYHNFTVNKKLYNFPQKHLLFTLKYLEKLKKFEHKHKIDMKRLNKYFQICKKNIITI